MMGGLNLSEWAINHKTLVTFFMVLCVVAGVKSYVSLGREEDPEFAVQTMLVQVNWPGATTADTISQITDRLEKKLRETPDIDYINSYTTPGQSVIYVNLLQSTPPDQIPFIWYEVRKKVYDIRQTFPQGIQGPFFNDEFGDVYGVIYGITFDGFTLRQTRDFAEQAKMAFQNGHDVSKVMMFGQQDQKFYLSFSPQKLAALGLNLNDVLNSIADQNALVPSGVVNTPDENILVNVTGGFLTKESLEAVNLFINNRFFHLTDIATVEEGYVDPPSKMFRVNGKQAIGLGMSMKAGGNNLEFGRGLAEIAARLQQDFPVGIDVVLVSDQPQVVKEAIAGFTDALLEALIIVLAVSFISLGLRAGLVVALSIPLVLSIVFIGMELAEISLQRISLGALIIALGLLVDDAMITVEMMVSKIEEGYEKAKAATFAYVTTAFPMLTGTLVTIFGFFPIGFADSNTGQYCFSLFAVIAIALVSSWFVAVVFAPVIGVFVLPNKIVAKHQEGAREYGRVTTLYKHLLLFCMRFRYLTIAVTLGLFALALFGQQFVQRQFFPSSDRPELLVTINLPAAASIFATEDTVNRVQKLIDGDPDIERYSNYIGGGAIRFYLPLAVLSDNDFIGQFVIVTKGIEERERVKAKLLAELPTAAPDVTTFVQDLELGPPVGWPIQYRVTGRTTDEARQFADELVAAMTSSGLARDINFDWRDKNKALRIVVDQDTARRVGLSSKTLQQALQAVLSGTTITQLRDSIYLIDLVARADDSTRASLEGVRNLQISLPNGHSVPLREVASIEYVLDEGYVGMRDGLPTMTVQANMMPGLQAATVYSRLRPELEKIRATLPFGTTIIEGGTVEKSAESNAALMAQVPIMVGMMLIILMVQLQSVSRLLLVVSVAPLGLIGVVAALLFTNTPMGFVATLGIIALAGMIIRNSVILIDQIEHTRKAGENAWEAVIEAAQHRFRPIMLTASAAILGMIPIMRDVFWGPMAYAIVGGLAGATLLTLLFLPALYVTSFRIKEPKSSDPGAARSGDPAGGAEPALAP
ncbi:efflux RND transporter permease subunit [Kaistia granuli]|uniref:efflux RND transporter permease subunit n=1 Tax=Kaistia granuli TaxID=363259 RepID=UPI00039D503B|nr:efflux RND transporter permease subunit [Kaistia granuli]